jgi:hypothetical protein
MRLREPSSATGLLLRNSEGGALSNRSLDANRLTFLIFVTSQRTSILCPARPRFFRCRTPGGMKKKHGAEFPFFGWLR